MDNIFYSKLKSLRQANHLTQEQLANELNLRYHLNESKATISQFENNKRIPDLDRLINIADYFHVSLDFLCCSANKAKDLEKVTNKSFFSHNLRKLCEKNNLSQCELSKMLDVSNGAISKWERGDRQPDYETLENIADTFNVTIDYLLGRSDSKQEFNESQMNFSTPQEALSFILKQDMVADFGGYDLDNMSDDEIMEMADDIADMLKIISRKHK